MPLGASADMLALVAAELDKLAPGRGACWAAPWAASGAPAADNWAAGSLALALAGGEPAKVHVGGGIGTASGAKSPLSAPKLVEAPWSGSLAPDLPAKIPLLHADGSDFHSDGCLVGHAGFDVHAVTGAEVAMQEHAGAAFPALPQENFQECRWHSSAKSVGAVSADGHIFTKTDPGGKKVIMSSRGTPVELSNICMVFDASLRSGGVHRYNYQILDGELGAADGVGFVFDKQVRRNNIQRMRSVFLNQRGRICLRDNGHVCKLRAQLPPLAVGMWLTLLIDLDSLCLQFAVFGPEGELAGVADVSVHGILANMSGVEVPYSGFFCAIVTKDISVALT